MQVQSVDGLYGMQLAGNAAVEQLQQKLKALAQVAAWPAVDPGPIDGMVGRQTVSAIASGATKILDEVADMPGWAKYALQAALAIALQSDSAMAEARGYIKQYASELTAAVTALVMKYGSGGQDEGPPVPSLPPGVRDMRVPIGKARRAVTHEEAEAQRAADSGYPVGTITTQSGPVWRVAVPKGMAAQLGGPGVSLGAGYVEVAPASNKPAGAQVVSPATFKSKITPWYKNWKVLAPLGIGAVLVGGGAWYLLR